MTRTLQRFKTVLLQPLLFSGFAFPDVVQVVAGSVISGREHDGLSSPGLFGVPSLFWRAKTNRIHHVKHLLFPKCKNPSQNENQFKVKPRHFLSNIPLVDRTVGTTKESSLCGFPQRSWRQERLRRRPW